MTTALQIIDRALEHLGIKGAGETTSAEDADAGLRALTSLLDALQSDRLDVVGLTELTYTPASGESQVTITSGGDINATMPAWLSDSSHYRIGSIDYPLPLKSAFDSYAAYPDKSSRGLPDVVCYMRSGSTGTLYIAPASDGNYQLRLWVPQEVITGQTTLALASSLAMPSGYRALLEYGVARELAITFERPDSVLARVEQRYKEALKRVKRANVQVPEMETPMGWPGLYNIEADA